MITWTLILLNVVIFLWDRQWHPFMNGSLTFADLAMRPREVVQAVKGTGDSRFALATVFTSMFLHGGILHLLGNMIFLLVFGAGVEAALGPARFALYYIFWGVAAATAQIYVDPSSTVPMLGASGAIGGVLGCYFLLFPSNKVEIWIPILFSFIVVSAWVMLGIWFFYQIFIPQNGVANWAHAGGFLAGMLTVLVAGGRKKVLDGREAEVDEEFD